MLQNVSRRVIHFIALWCCGTFCRGQQLHFSFYDKSTGLVSNEVHSIIQAHNGVMYFGTPSGLSVFDGANFTNYDLRKGFRDNMITVMQEQHDGRMLLFTGNDHYYALNPQLIFTDSYIPKNTLQSVAPPANGGFYVASNTGLYQFAEDKVTRVPVYPGKLSPGITCVAMWQDSLLIIGRNYEPVEIYNTHSWQLVAASEEKLFVRNIHADPNGNAWISTIGSGVLLVSPSSVMHHSLHFEKLPTQFLPYSNTEFRAVVTDQDSNLWMATVNKGLIKFNWTTGAFQHIGMEQGMVSNTVFALFCDKENNIWIGTNRGLQKLTHKNMTWYDVRQGLPADLVLDVLPLPGNRMVTCGYSGVAYLQGTGNKSQTWHPPLEDEYFLHFIPQGKNYYGLSVKKLVALHISNNNISAGAVYDLPQHCHGITAADEQHLILGGDSSIYLFSSGKLQPLTGDSVHFISCMNTDPSGNLWTGSFNNTINGYVLKKSNGSITASHTCYATLPGAEAGNYIQCITPGQNGKVWCGTLQKGIVVFLPAMNQLIQQDIIDITNGLGSNNVSALYWYNDTTLLAGTGSGLDKIIFPKGSNHYYIRNISSYYDFSSSVYAIQKDEQGNIILGTETGLVKIRASAIESVASPAPPVIITSVHLLSSPDSVININRDIELSYNNSGIIVNFASPSFINEKNTRYLYRLEGSHQNNWSQPSASNSITLLHLLPGEYRFAVKAVNMFGVLSTTEAVIIIKIRPAYWQSWWFYPALLLIAAGLLFFIVQRRIRSIRYEASLRNKIAETEMMALRAQMNPHFIFNCMNIIDGLITGNRNDDALDFLQKFSRLIRLVLENSQYQQIPVQQELQALELYTTLEVIRNNHRFTCVFDIDKALLEHDYKIPPLLLQPYIENAIVHGLRNKEGDDGKLLVRMQREKGYIRIVIEDNGIGRTAAALLNATNKKPHQHLGMKVTGKRIELLQQVNDHEVQLTVEDVQQEDDKGTRVTIVLPEHLKFQ